MTPSEAIEIARLKAGEINYPWSSETAVAKRWGIWPGRRNWRVISRIPSEGATVTMNVFERTREAHPVRAVWTPDTPQPIQPLVLLSAIFKLIVSGCLFWLFARYIKHWPIWGATLFAMPLSYVGLIAYEMIASKIGMWRTRNYILEKRADQQKKRRASRQSKKNSE